MRKLITLIVIGLLTLSTGFSQTVDFSINPPTSNHNLGDQFCLDVEVSNFTDIVSMQFSINYDETVLQFDEATNFNLPGLGGSNVGNPGPGDITVSWLADDIINGETVSDGTSIFQICFEAIITDGTSPIDYSGSPTSIEFSNTDGLIDFNPTNGEVIVGSGGGGGGSMDVTFIAPDETANNGDNICIPITVENFNSIVSMQYSINYDETILSYTGSQNYGLGGLGGSNIGNPSAGDITISWLADDVLNGETVTDGTTIFEICFDVIGGGGDVSPVDFSGNPTSVEVTDPDGVLDPVFMDGSVTVNGGGGGSMDVTFIAPDETADNGDNICIPITVENFNSIVSMQYSINYDETVLSYTGSQNYGLGGFGGSNIGNPSAGDITVSWLADDVLNGETVADGTVIFELCFDVIGSGGDVSPLDFSGNPTSVEVTDPDGVLNPAFVDGSVTVNGGGGGSMDVTFIAPDETADNGDNICIPITVENFNSIVSMQYSINYDETVLSYTGSQNYGLGGFGSSNIGNPSAGDITVSWLADDVLNGETVADGTVIFELCFDVIGSGGDVSPLDFSGNPTSVEVTDPDGVLNPAFVDGSVTVNGGGGGSMDVTFIAPDETADNGDNICIPITVENFNSIVSMQYSINYDETVLSYTGSQNYGLGGFGSSNIGNPSAGDITVSWLADDVLNGETVADGTVIFELCFDVIGSGGDVSPLDFSGNPTSVEVTDPDGVLNPAFVDGSVTVNGGGGGSMDVTFIAPDETADNGDNICIPITVENFNSIVSMQYSINYDETVLSYTGSQNYGLGGFGSSNIGNPSAGDITVSWLADDVLNGETVADGTVIFELCFDVIGSGGDVSPLDFSGNPTSVEVTDPDGVLNPAFVDGSVTVNGGGGGSMDVTFIAPDETADNGDNICIPITVENFNSIVSMQYSINYDETVLSYTGSQNYGLGGFGSSNIGNPSAGDITVSWLADDVLNGETVTDGTVIFELCFDVIGGSGDVSPLDFSGNPTSVEVTDPSGVVDPVFVDGSVTVNGGGGGSNELTFIFPDENAAEDDNICIPITVENFNDIVSVQYSINYDPTVLSYTGSQNYGLSGLGASNIGNPNPGDITLSWVADDVVNGETVPDGTVIFELCFDVIGSSGDVSPGDFSGDPTSIEVSDADGLITPVFDDGSVTVDGGGPSSFLLTIDDILVENGDDFCLSVTAEGFTDIVSMQFSINYDPALLAYTGPGNFQLNGVNASSFGNPSAGNITFSWVADDPVNGETLPDGSVLFDICFTALGPNCSATMVEFSGSPTSIEISDADGLVNFDGENGLVDICDGDPPTPFTLIASEELVGAGENVCVDITVLGFNDIVSMQGSINYNPSVLSFTGVQNINLPGLSPSDVANPSAGNITYSWVADDPVNGQTLSDNTVLFQLCFDAIGNLGDISGINFSGTPTPEEFSDANGLVTPIFDDGSVEIANQVCDPIVVLESITDPCPGTAQGSINLTVSGGDGQFTYAWDNGANTQDLNNLSAGTYTVTITSCTESFTQSYMVEELPGIEITGEFITNVACFGGTSGSVFINVTGEQPLSYMWTGSGPISNPNAQNLINLSAGNYSVTITDGNGCTLESGPYQVNQPASALAAQVSNVEDVTCAGDNDGSISLSVSGGTPGYNYTWTPTLPNTGNPTNLSGGIYDVEVQDANGCIMLIAGIEVEEPDPIVINIDNVQDESILGEDGSISVSVSGGTGSLNYQWTGPDPDAPFTTQDISGLVAGEYTLLVDDTNGCQEEITVEVIKPLAVEIISVTPSCFGEANGAIDVEVSGGCQPYDISWAGPGNPIPDANGDVSGLAGGTYTITVEDCDGSVFSIQINVFEAPTAVGLASFNVQDVSSQGSCDGSITVAAEGGSGPYTYNWSNGPTGTINNGLCIGSYLLTVTDANGCTFDTSFVVSFIPPPLVQETNLPVDVDCFGESSGGWVVEIEGGCPPYTFDFSDIGPMISNDGEITRTNLPAGDYCVTITDNCNTPQEIEICTTIDQLPPVVITDITIFPNTTGSNGAIDITVEGGDFPYNYQWSNGSTAPNPTNQLPGCQTVVIEDDNGCVLVSDDICIPTLQLEVSEKEDVFCSSDSDGTVLLDVLGGINEPLSITWFDANGNQITADSNFVENLPPGQYSAVVTDDLGVTSQPIVVTINFTSDIIANASAIFPPEYNGFNVSCFGAADGTATASASNGQAPYTYQWCDALGTGATLENLSAGTYCVVVTDNLGCIDTAEVSLNAPMEIVLTEDNQDVTCFGEDDGRASVKVFGGVEPFDFSWDDLMAQETNPAILLPTGEYSVTVTDDNGCVAELTTTVEQPDSLTLDLIVTDDSGEGDGAVAAIVEGGTEPYSLLWSNGENGTLLEDLRAGEYFVEVTDARGCVITGGAVVLDASIDCLEYREVISPDEDGLNDVLIINCNLLYENNHLEIYNRWGQLVYQTNQYDNDWAGVNQAGEQVPDGIYYFIFEYQDFDGQLKQFKGHVTVLR